MSKINGNEIRPGFIIEHDSGLWAAVKVNHVKPGKGGAFALCMWLHGVLTWLQDRLSLLPELLVCQSLAAGRQTTG